ncbi:hypothetical protein [Paenibacillus sp. 23TSA30-6]|uniref:hypothetical protein n=1 Tax=Paenibacillus sp. 23TSA30-6 TaxID=2546104 RepID=UPI001787AC0F|nr:hypothetical protein [Paenibacillus sp. 23TSA30-6]MBE0336833.1 hypothetical protein [Paenibacillus sp. 23TSA30-6]
MEFKGEDGMNSEQPLLSGEGQQSPVLEQREHPKKGKRFKYAKFRKVIAIIMAALLPGLGHLFLGLFIRGLTFIVLLLLDIFAMLYVASDGLRINIPLLILLGLFIPVLYFYNVYDVLQSADYMVRYRRKPDRYAQMDARGQQSSPFYVWERGLSFAVLLVAGGGLMILFRMKPRWLGNFFEDYGFLTLAILLMLIGLLVFLREVGLSIKRKKVKERG